MVQIFETGNPQGKIAEMLGMSLGQGLGNGLNTYYANKALNDVLEDNSMKDAPISAKMGKLQSALQPYGEKGQEIFQQRLGIEQQAQQEKQAKVQQKESREKEKRLFEHQKSLQSQKDQAANERANLRPPPGGVTAQPVPPQVNQAIESVLANAKGLSADQLKLAMDQAQIPPIYSNGYVESRRQETKPTFEPESEKLEAKRVADLATSVENDYFSAKNENIRLGRMKELSGKETLSTPLMVKAMDAIGLPIGILSNPDTEEYRKLETDFIRDASQVFPGGKITNYEIQSYLKTIPSLMNSPEGREAIIRNRELFNKAKEIRYDEYKNILKENGGKKPQNLGVLLQERTADKLVALEDEFKQGIQKEIEKFQQPIPMIDPQGRTVNIPPSDIEKAIKAGAKFR